MGFKRERSVGSTRNEVGGGEPAVESGDGSGGLDLKAQKTDEGLQLAYLLPCRSGGDCEFSGSPS